MGGGGVEPPSSLRLRDFLGARRRAGERALQELGDRREVGPQRLLHRRGAQRRGRVEERQQEDGAAAELVDLRGAAHLGDPGRAAAQQLGREVAEGADDARLDQPHLLEQVGLAGLDLLRLGIAVARRPRLEHVGDEDVVAGEPDLLQHLVQQLAGAADEGQPLAVLFGPRCLADEHQVGVGVAGPEDRLGAGLVQGAPRAVLDLLKRATSCSRRSSAAALTASPPRRAASAPRRSAPGGRLPARAAAIRSTAPRPRAAAAREARPARANAASAPSRRPDTATVASAPTSSSKRPPHSSHSNS